MTTGPADTIPNTIKGLPSVNGGSVGQLGWVRPGHNGVPSNVELPEYDVQSQNRNTRPQHDRPN
jgi:hypothetical protein